MALGADEIARLEESYVPHAISGHSYPLSASKSSIVSTTLQRRQRRFVKPG
jgi:hypothetical protein